MNALTHIQKEVITFYHVIYAEGTKSQQFNNLADAKKFKKIMQLMEENKK